MFANGRDVMYRSYLTDSEDFDQVKQFSQNKSEDNEACSCYYFFFSVQFL